MAEDNNKGTVSAAEMRKNLPIQSTEPTKPAEEAKPEAVEAMKEDTPSEEAPQVAEEPRKYAGKFESVDDLEKSYLEAEKKLTQTAQESAENRKAVDYYETLYGTPQEEGQVPEVAEQPQEQYQPEQELDYPSLIQNEVTNQLKPYQRRLELTKCRSRLRKSFCQ